MFEKLNPAVEAFIGSLVNSAQRFAWFVLVVSLVATTLIGRYTVNHLAINTDTEEMLSEKLAWRVTHEAYKDAFPHFTDTIVIVLDGVTADVARDGAAALAQRLGEHDQLIAEVFYPRNDPFFRRNQFLFLDEPELESLTNQLSTTQAFLARLSADRSSAALFELLNDALTSDPGRQTEGLATALDRIARAIAELNNGNVVPMSWQALMSGDDGTQQHREIVVVRPLLDYSVLLPAAPAMAHIRATAAELGLNPDGGVSVKLTGAAALSNDELQSVIRGSQNAGMLALVMVLACLLVGLRSFSLVVATISSLLVGLVFTAGFAVFAVGTLNMISIAFAVLYVGLGVDFAIHICLRYREILRTQPANNALNEASRHVGVSLILCATTTAIGFFAFIPTAYRGVAELGLIAGTGMFISLAISLVLLPALLQVLPAPRAPRAIAMLPTGIARVPQKYSRAVLAGAGIVWVLAALTLPGTHFDTDPISLNDPHAESVLTFRELQRDHDNSPMSIAVGAESDAAAQELAVALAQLPEVSSTRTIESFVPAAQDEKLAIVDDLALVLGGDLAFAPSPPFDRARTEQAIMRLVQTIDEVGDDDAPLTASRQRLRSALQGLRRNNGDATQRLLRLDDKLLASFEGRIALLRDGLTPNVFTADDLPQDLRERWRSPRGPVRLEVYPKSDLSGPHDIKRFVSAVKSAVGDAATGTPVINLGGSEAVKLAFIQAFSSAFVLISVLLWCILRSLKEVALALAPLILAGLITAALSVVFSVPFNFANIIALPLLLGIGVDSALHILHRYKTALPAHGNLLQTSTARAVFFSALTTTVSFGNLASSTHAGTASMGVMLTIGVISTLCCTLLVLPAMLEQFMPQARAADA